MRKMQIVLTVDAETLYHMKNYNQDDIDSYCSLTDNGGKADNGKVQDFLSNVYLSKSVEWVRKQRLRCCSRLYMILILMTQQIFTFSKMMKKFMELAENSKVVLP
jgi:hypothetical protein